MYILSTPQRREEFEEKIQKKIKKQKSYLEETTQPHKNIKIIIKYPLTVIRDNLTR